MAGTACAKVLGLGSGVGWAVLVSQHAELQGKARGRSGSDGTRGQSALQAENQGLGESGVSSLTAVCWHGDYSARSALDSSQPRAWKRNSQDTNNLAAVPKPSWDSQAIRPSKDPCLPLAEPRCLALSTSCGMAQGGESYQDIGSSTAGLVLSPAPPHSLMQLWWLPPSHFSIPGRGAGKEEAAPTGVSGPRQLAHRKGILELLSIPPIACLPSPVATVAPCPESHLASTNEALYS